jgi:deazaflavin-dependent oxidoreductase (nitroreductase family)
MSLDENRGLVEPHVRAGLTTALDIGPDSSAAERTIDITTLGARTGIPRRVEVWLHRVDGRWYLTGMPRPRSWYANLRANPAFIVHLKHGVTADLPATAAPVDAPTRRRVITAVLDLQSRPDVAARVSRRQDLHDWLARSPLVEIVFDDEPLRMRPREVRILRTSGTGDVGRRFPSCAGLGLDVHPTDAVAEQATAGQLR